MERGASEVGAVNAGGRNKSPLNSEEIAAALTVARSDLARVSARAVGRRTLGENVTAIFRGSHIVENQRRQSVVIVREAIAELEQLQKVVAQRGPASHGLEVRSEDPLNPGFGEHKAVREEGQIAAHEALSLSPAVGIEAADLRADLAEHRLNDQADEAALATAPTYQDIVAEWQNLSPEARSSYQPDYYSGAESMAVWENYTLQAWSSLPDEVRATHAPTPNAVAEGLALTDVEEGRDFIDTIYEMREDSLAFIGFEPELAGEMKRADWRSWEKLDRASRAEIAAEYAADPDAKGRQFEDQVAAFNKSEEASRHFFSLGQAERDAIVSEYRYGDPGPDLKHYGHAVYLSIAMSDRPMREMPIASLVAGEEAGLPRFIDRGLNSRFLEAERLGLLVEEHKRLAVEAPGSNSLADVGSLLEGHAKANMQLAYEAFDRKWAAMSENNVPPDAVAALLQERNRGERVYGKVDPELTNADIVRAFASAKVAMEPLGIQRSAELDREAAQSVNRHDKGELAQRLEVLAEDLAAGRDHDERAFAHAANGKGPPGLGEARLQEWDHEGVRDVAAPSIVKLEPIMDRQEGAPATHYPDGSLGRQVANGALQAAIVARGLGSGHDLEQEHHGQAWRYGGTRDNGGRIEHVFSHAGHPRGGKVDLAVEGFPVEALGGASLLSTPDAAWRELDKEKRTDLIERYQKSTGLTDHPFDTQIRGQLAAEAAVAARHDRVDDLRADRARSNEQVKGRTEEVAAHVR